MSERPPMLWTRGFASVLAAQVGFGYAFSTFFLLPKYLAVALGAGPEQIGLLTAAHGFTVVAFMPAMGALVDRHGRRGFLTAGALLMLAASLGYTAVDAFGPLLFALRIAQGLAFAMAFTAGSALAVDEAPPERVAQAIGLFGLTFLSMNAVGPAVVEEVSGRVGWPAAFALAAGGAALCALLSRRVYERSDAREGHGPAVGLLEVVSRPSMLRTMLVIALVGTAFHAIFTFHQPFAVESGIARVRTFFVAYATTAITVRVGFGGWFDRLGRRRAALSALGLYVGVALLASVLPATGLAPLGASLGLAHGVFYPTYNALAVEGAGPRERGKVMALYQAAFTVGGSLGPLALGHLAAAAGYPAVFRAAAVCVAVAFCVLALSPEGRGEARAGA